MGATPSDQHAMINLFGHDDYAALQHVTLFVLVNSPSAGRTPHQSLHRLLNRSQTSSKAAKLSWTWKPAQHLLCFLQQPKRRESTSWVVSATGLRAFLVFLHGLVRTGENQTKLVPRVDEFLS